jgi:hypothetical protein
MIKDHVEGFDVRGVSVERDGSTMNPERREGVIGTS